jgi:hypothetical protein
MCCVVSCESEKSFVSVRQRFGRKAASAKQRAEGHVASVHRMHVLAVDAFVAHHVHKRACLHATVSGPG